MNALHSKTLYWLLLSFGIYATLTNRLSSCCRYVLSLCFSSLERIQIAFMIGPAAFIIGPANPVFKSIAEAVYDCEVSNPHGYDVYVRAYAHVRVA